MNLFSKCDDCVFPEDVTDRMILCCGDEKTETIKQLEAKIAKLETDLRRQKAAADTGNKLLRLMRGDNFSGESLH